MIVKCHYQIIYWAIFDIVLTNVNYMPNLRHLIIKRCEIEKQIGQGKKKLFQRYRNKNDRFVNKLFTPILFFVWFYFFLLSDNRLYERAKIELGFSLNKDVECEPNILIQHFICYD